MHQQQKVVANNFFLNKSNLSSQPAVLRMQWSSRGESVSNRDETRQMIFSHPRNKVSQEKAYAALLQRNLGVRKSISMESLCNPVPNTG